MEGLPKKSSLQQASITDVLNWYRRKELELNPAFQRRSLWTLDARSYLIDTLLLGFSIPKIYLRTKIDTTTQTSIRDVVDGQQRLRAIIDFADNSLELNRRSRQFKGKRYRDLDPEYQEAFLGYEISIEHLANASDNTVLEMFARLNTYTYRLNPAELRNAAYDTDLKWLVFWAADDSRWFLRKYNIVTLETMVRMDDDVFFAELVNILMNGIVDGGAAGLDRLYRDNQAPLPESEEYRLIIIDSINWLDQTIAPLLSGVLGRSYQLHMLVAAYVHQTHGLRPGRLLEIAEMPERSGLGPAEQILQRLGELAEAVDNEDLEGPHKAFVEASTATTRWRTRTARFLAYNNAISAR
jgi:hypothetical protein